MKIEPKTVTVRELTEGYTNSEEDGVYGYGGRLNIRPAFQREFVYKDKQRDAVLDTVRRGFPLNTMYWSHNTEDDTYELLDGQQRTLSLCEYVAGSYSIEFRGWGNLTQEERDAILDYEVFIYVAEGSEREKLDWFKVINIAAEKLTDQELRNAVYTGTWLTDAKRWFSRPNAPAKEVGEGYVSGSPIRQDYLQKALQWVALRDDLNAPEGYMAEHQHDADANDLWNHYKRVVDWARATFPVSRRELKSVDWGSLFHDYGTTYQSAGELEERVAALMLDDEVTKKAGIYPYLFDGKERHLSLRAFTANQKREAYERQKGVCPVCGERYDLADMEADHITPWSQGGKTTAANCQMLCEDDNRSKSNK